MALSIDASGNINLSIGITGSLTICPAPVAASTPPAFRAAETAGSGTGTVTISKPTTIDGDVMIAVIGAINSAAGPPLITTLSGWTLIRSDTQTNARMSSYYRIASGEGSSYTWANAATQGASGIIVTYSGANAAPIDVSGGQNTASSDTITAPSVTTTVANTQLLGIYFTQPSSPIIGYSDSQIERAVVAETAGDYLFLAVADLAKPAAGITGIRTATASGTIDGIGQSVAIKP